MLLFWSTIPCFNHTVRNIYIFWVHWVDLRYVLCLQAFEETELLRLVYFGGVDASLRKEVWPFLLGHYQFGMSDAERKKVCRFHDYGFASQTFPTSNPDPWSLIPHPSPQVDEQVRVCYQQTMREWLGCEEIVRQREKEQHAVALAKCSTGVSMDSSSQKLIHRDSTVSNEVKQRQTHLFRVTDCAHRNVYSQCRHFKKESAVYVVSLISFLYRKVTVYKA